MRMPGAQWVGPTANENPGGELAVYGVVVHIQEGTEAGTESWQRNPAAEVSSHFLAPKAGGIRQMVDTADKAWAEAAGNAHWLSVECEGRSGETLTDAQEHAVAAILSWAHSAYGVPLRLCTDPVNSVFGGLTWHAAGGVSWGNHPDCPGQPIIAQLPGMVELAAAGTPTPPPITPQGDPMLTNWTTVKRGDSGPNVSIAQGLLIARGYPVGSRNGLPDGGFGPTTEYSTRALQHDHGITVDGIFGPHTLSVALYGRDLLA